MLLPVYLPVCVLGLLLGAALAQDPKCPSLVPVEEESSAAELDLSAFNVDTNGNYFLGGSCTSYRDTGCCSTGDCAGDPPTLGCYCDRQCYALEDCCLDVNIANTCPPKTQDDVHYLEFLHLNEVNQVFLPREDDGLSQAIHIPGGFPFGDSTQTVVYMSTNGYFSFGSRVNDFNPSLFPTEDGYTYFVSPFWADATIEGNVSGQVSYEVHSAGNGTQPSGLLSNISVYISEAVGEAFQGDWMLVGEWKEVPPVTGLNIETNTFQGILITNGSQSYALFLYECDKLKWRGLMRYATIGFIANDSFYFNHRLSGTKEADDIDCLDDTFTPWTTLVYRIAPPHTENGKGSFSLLPLIAGGVVSETVATIDNTYIDTESFVLSEIITSIPVFLQWTLDGNHTLYYAASSWSLDSTISPPACIKPNSGSLEPGETQVMEVEFSCSGAGFVYMQACITIGTQPFDLLNGTYHTFTFYYPRQCNGPTFQLCSAPSVSVVPGELCLTSEQLMSLIAYRDSSWFLLDFENDEDTDYCIISSDVSSSLILPIPDAFPILSLYIGPPPYTTSPVVYLFSFEVENTTVLDSPYIGSGDGGILYTNRTDIQLHLPCRHVGRTQVYVSFNVSFLIDGTLYQEKYLFHFQKICANASLETTTDTSEGNLFLTAGLPVIIIFILALVILAIVMVVFFASVRSKNLKRLQLSSTNTGFIDRSLAGNHQESLLNNYEFLGKVGLEYDYSKLELQEQLGQGHFGVVYKGKAPGIYRGSYVPGEFVAVKTLKMESFHVDVLDEFFKEVQVAMQFDHPNVIRLLAICTNSPQKCMILEYMDLGSLNELLRSSDPAAPHSHGDQHVKGPITPEHLPNCILQVAQGLAYLSSLNFVHRDIATRNCLVNHNLVIKIADFGMSRAVDSTNYYQIGSGRSFLPVRWMPPEAILHGKFTVKSDVWSFGVLMWEVYTFGHQPYAGITNYEVVEEVKNRQILECPVLCPPIIYEIMTSCWTYASSKRPAMAEVVEQLQTSERQASDVDDEYIQMAPVVAVKFSELLALEEQEDTKDLEEKWDFSKDVAKGKTL